MPRRADISLATLKRAWDRSPFNGGMQGIASVAVATLAVGVVCSLVAAVVSLIY